VVCIYGKDDSSDETSLDGLELMTMEFDEGDFDEESFCELLSPMTRGDMDDERVFCNECSCELRADDDELKLFFRCFDDNPDNNCDYCSNCHDAGEQFLFECVKEESEELLSQCKLTKELPVYDTAMEYRCTPDDYGQGYKESYSPSSYLAYCRHSHTNYEELIDGLGQSGVDAFVYRAVKRRCNELVRQSAKMIRRLAPTSK
jgi:hypothetical protein